MFLAHFGVGLGAKAAAPRVSLGTLFVAAQFLDLLWPTLLLLGVESVRIAPGLTPGQPLQFEHYPVSHSLLAVLGWALLLSGGHYAWRRRGGDALVLGAAVLSHWLLDLLVHYPDLPLYPGSSPMLGFAWWSSLPLTLAAEFVLFALGLKFYLDATRARDAAGRWGLVGLVALLVIIQLSNTFGPPPGDVTALAWSAQAQWILVVWAYWLDRHRQVRRDDA